MSDSHMVEKWNVLDSGAMAVSVEAALYRYIHGKPKPHDFASALEGGMEFLKEAGNAGAIMCGRCESSDFGGTLSPLSWSTDAYIQIEFAPESLKEAAEKVDYRTVTDRLHGYRDLLHEIKEGRSEEKTQQNAKKAHEFFHALSEVLMSEADPTTRTYSHEVR